MSGFWVSGIVANRDKKPYIQLSNEKGMIAQLSVTETHQIATDMMRMIARAEADAIIHKFFAKMGFPIGALGALMQEFRDFRAELDADVATRAEEGDSQT